MTTDFADDADGASTDVLSDSSVSSATSVVKLKAMPTDEPLPTRASLLERLKDLGDDASWSEFARTYHELIFSVARRAGLNETEAGEVVQDTLISVAKKMPGFTYDPAKDSFKGWQLTVTRWRVRDQFEKQKRGNPALTHRMGEGARRAGEGRAPNDATSRTGTVERVPDPAGSVLAALWDEEWEKHLLQTALARIKRTVHPQQYEIYHLHVILGQPVREVTRALGVNAGQVYLARHRVGRSLRKEIEQLVRALMKAR
jgi:RNA polymerase sigma-70 factor (ECF subfamily)